MTIFLLKPANLIKYTALHSLTTETLKEYFPTSNLKPDQVSKLGQLQNNYAISWLIYYMLICIKHQINVQTSVKNIK